MTEQVQEKVITREQWVRRYANRIKQRTGLAEEQAMEVADVGAQAYEESERGCGNAVVFHGYSYGAANGPEDEADEELTYWDNDE